MDFMNVLGRLLLIPIYTGIFIAALFSPADDKVVVMGLSVLMGLLSWQITKPARKHAKVA